MNTPRKKVWELVHSLTPSECMKFYDRAFEHKRGRYSNYVILFDALKEQEVFDDPKLRKKLKGREFLGHLHRVKNYLYERILEYVREARNDGESELYALLEKIKFLFEKRLYHHLDPKIKKAENLATEMEDFNSYFKILHYRREMLRNEKDWRNYQENILSLGHLEECLIRKLHEKVQLKKIHDRLLGLPRHSLRGDELLEIEGELGRFKDFQSQTANIIFLQVEYNIAFRRGDFRSCINSTDAITRIFQKYPDLLQDYGNFKTHVSAVYLGSNLRIFFNEFADSDKTFALINSLGNAQKREPALFFEKRLLHEFAIGRKTLDFKRLLDALESFNNIPNQVVHILDPTSMVEIHHLAALGAFIMRDYRKVLEIILKMPGIKPVSVRPDLKNFSRVLFLVTHYELDNLDMVEQGVRSARIAFKRKKVMNSFYVEVFRLFAKLFKAQNKTEKEIAFTHFQTLFNGPDTSIFQAMNNYFDIKAWVKSKLETIPFQEVLRTEFNNG